MQTQCLSIPVRPGRTARLTEWIRSLSGRREEVLAALAAEGIAAETVMLQRGSPDRLLIFVAAEDLLAANAAFQTSTAAVDVEFRELMGETLDLAGAELVDVLLHEVRG